AVAADVNRDVLGIRGRAEEEEVARPERSACDRRPVMELRVRVARDRQPVGAVDVPDEPGAVEAPGGESAPEVVRAEEAPRLRDDRRVRRPVWRLRADERAAAVRRADDV